MPMRVFAVTAVILLLLEAVLVLVFLAGLYWLGGWVGGALLCAGVLLLMALPWIGELAVHVDSAAGSITAKMSWWGSFSYEWGPKPNLCVRVLGIPWRKRMEKRKPRKQRRRRSRTMHVVRENAGQLVRVMVSSLQAGHEMLTEAEELSLEVTAPTQISYADQAIAGVVGSRRYGPLGLSCAAEGRRRVTVRYRIGLLRAALAGLYMAADSRPWKLGRGTRNENKA